MYGIDTRVNQKVKAIFKLRGNRDGQRGAGALRSIDNAC